MTPSVNRSPSQVKAVLFDLDGVLIHSYDAWFRLFNNTLVHFGFQNITEQVFRQHWGQSTKQDVEIFMPGRTVAEVREYFNEHYQEYIPYITLDPEAHSVLGFLKDKKLMLGCVTNSHRPITDAIMRHHALHSYFSAVLTADDVEHPKPAPDLIVLALKHLDIHPEETVFIGDTITDIKAGTEAGCIMLGYRVEYTQRVDTLAQARDLIVRMMQ
jgi:HAD superfamily hydrolase (TIGR01509 family)